MVKPSKKAIQSKKDSTERRILTAAREEFIRQGLKGARMQAIADRAQVNKALLHYYFRTKEKLYDAVLQNILQTVWCGLREQFSKNAGADDIRTLLQLVITVYIKALAENPDFPRIMLREVADGGNRLPTLIENFVSSFGDIPLKIRKLIEQEIRRKKIRPLEPIHLAINILGMCVFTFIARPVLSMAAERGVLKLKFDEAFYEKRIESILSMACDGIYCKERVK